MADIIQAAKWMQEGKERCVERGFAGDYVGMIRGRRGIVEFVGRNLTFDDLLADDWEIAEEPPSR